MRILIFYLFIVWVFSNCTFGANSWTCQGVCAFIDKTAVLYPIVVSDPLTIVTMDAETSGEAFRKALDECRKVIPHENQTALARLSGANLKPGTSMIVASIMDSCQHNSN